MNAAREGRGVAHVEAARIQRVAGQRTGRLGTASVRRRLLVPHELLEEYPHLAEGVDPILVDQRFVHVIRNNGELVVDVQIGRASCRERV